MAKLVPCPYLEEARKVVSYLHSFLTPLDSFPTHFSATDFDLNMSHLLAVRETIPPRIIN